VRAGFVSPVMLLEGVSKEYEWKFLCEQAWLLGGEFENTQQA